MLWSLGTSLVNAYVVYCKLCDEEGIPKANRQYNHYEFLEEIALYWANPSIIELEQKLPGTSVTRSSSEALLSDEQPPAKKPSHGTSYITPKSLGPTGFYQCRLAGGAVDHLPLPGKPEKNGSNPPCAMHRMVYAPFMEKKKRYEISAKYIIM